MSNDQKVAVYLSQTDWTVVREILEQTMNAKTVPGAWQLINIYEALNAAGIPSIYDRTSDPLPVISMDQITPMDPSTESDETEETN